MDVVDVQEKKLQCQQSTIHVLEKWCSQGEVGHLSHDVSSVMRPSNACKKKTFHNAEQVSSHL